MASGKRKGKECAAYGCSSRFYGPNGEPTGLHFFSFPRCSRRLNRWCNLIKRQHGKDGFSVTNSTVVCQNHFRLEVINKTLTGRWDLRPDTEPSIFPWVTKVNRPTRRPPRVREQPSAADLSDSPEQGERGMELNDLAVSDQGIPTDISDSPEQGERLMELNDLAVSDHGTSEGTNAEQSMFEAATQTDDIFINCQDRISFLEEQLQVCQQQLQESEAKGKRLEERQFSLGKIQNDNAAISFYTGFPNYDSLVTFFNYLKPKIKKIQYWKGGIYTSEVQPYQQNKDRNKPGPPTLLNSLDEFFLVLLRLKCGLFVQDLANRFGISTGLVSKICITWINLLYFELKLIFPFPSQELVRKNMPKEFAKFPTTRIILDCTEVFMERPSAMLAQSETWSDYKHHNTWKSLVGITPNGQVTFVSKLWGGRVSDKQITQESGVLSSLDPGDNVMADRGFDIERIMPVNVTLNIPPFLAGREQLTAEQTEETMVIASVRIHVERAIGRIKNYHILDGTLPNTLSSYANQIFTVCALLTNFLPPLLKPERERCT